MISLRQLFAAWNRFFFEPISPLSIAAFRICYGVVLLANELLLLPDFYFWYGQKGSLSQTVGRQISGGGFTLLNYLPATDLSAVLLFSLMLVAIVTLILGWFTRTSAITAFLCLVSFNHRSPMPLNAGDTLLRITGFFLIFSNAGACLSLDRRRDVARGRAGASIMPSAPWALRLIQIQISLLYISTFLWKVGGSNWVDGTAIFYTSRMEEFWRFPVPYLFEHLWTIKLLTIGTLITEFALGILIWIREFRYPVLLAGVLFHLGIDYSMNIPLFSLIMIAGYITFIEPRDISRIVTFFQKRFGGNFVEDATTSAPPSLEGSASPLDPNRI